MQIHELTPSECAEVLQRASVGRLACARDGQPYIVPIHFSFDPEQACIYSFSTVGQKISWMRDNPRVCMEIDDVTDKDHWLSVVVFGRYEELPTSPGEPEPRQRAQDLFQQRPEWWLPAAAKVDSRERDAFVVYRIQIERLTGRRADRGARASAAPRMRHHDL